MERIRQSFDRQGFMRTLGATLESVEPGTVTITCGFDERLTQQHGLLHGGLLASLVDVACGYAALSVMPADREVLTVEFKINFLKPATTVWRRSLVASDCGSRDRWPVYKGTRDTRTNIVRCVE